MPIGFAPYSRAILPKNHWQALEAADALLLDLAINGLEELVEGIKPADLEIAGFLPTLYRVRYNETFLRRFLVCLTSIGFKLQLHTFLPLSCTAEELALVAVIELASCLVEQENDIPRFQAWFALVCAHPDVRALFGFAVSDRDAFMRRPALQFQHWFAAFSSESPVHPYIESLAL